MYRILLSDWNSAFDLLRNQSLNISSKQKLSSTCIDFVSDQNVGYTFGLSCPFQRGPCVLSELGLKEGADNED